MRLIKHALKIILVDTGRSVNINLQDMKRALASLFIGAFLLGFVLHSGAHAADHGGPEQNCVVCHLSHTSTPAPVAQPFNPIFTMSHQLSLAAPRIAVFVFSSSEASRAPPSH